MGKAKKSKYDNVMDAGGKAIKILLEVCMKNGIENPKIEIDVNATDGSKYILKFERIDLDL